MLHLTVYQSVVIHFWFPGPCTSSARKDLVMKQRTFSVRALALILALLIAEPSSLSAPSSPALPDPGSLSGITREQQVQLGEQAAAEVYKQLPALCDSSRL